MDADALVIEVYDDGGKSVSEIATECAAKWDQIYCGADEWGNETMRRLAEEWFHAHQGSAFVLVYEHAGWFLGYRRDGSIWCSANDAAVLSCGPQPTGGCSGVYERRP